MVTKNTKVVAARIPNYLYDKLVISATKKRLTLSALITRAIKVYYQLK